MKPTLATIEKRLQKIEVSPAIQQGQIDSWYSHILSQLPSSGNIACALYVAGELDMIEKPSAELWQKYHDFERTRSANAHCILTLAYASFKEAKEYLAPTSEQDFERDMLCASVIYQWVYDNALPSGDGKVDAQRKAKLHSLLIAGPILRAAPHLCSHSASELSTWALEQNGFEMEPEKLYQSLLQRFPAKDFTDAFVTIS